MIRLFRQFVPKRKLLLLASECALLMAVLLVGTSLPGIRTRDVFDATSGEHAKGLLSAFTVAVLCQVSLSYSDLYDWRVSRNRRDLPNRLLNAAGMSFVTLAIIVFLLPGLFYFPGLPELQGQTWKLVVLLVLSYVLLFYWRVGFHWFFYKWGFGEKLVILGTGRLAQELGREIRDNPEVGFEIVGTVGQVFGEEADVDNPGADDAALLPHLGPPEALVDLAAEGRISRVVVALEERRENMPTELLLSCRLAGVRVEEREALYERLHGKISLANLKPSYLIFGSGFEASRLVRGVKRTIDILLSLTGFLVSLPVMLVVAVVVRLDSRGPAILRQKRIGQNNMPFVCFKFRTMRVDAEEHTGPVWALKADDRVTKVGRWLRVSRLDELPQLWNILRGEMSFIGPRPERPFFVEQLEQQIPFYGERLSVRPGLTGWAQIKHPYAASIDDARTKLEYDLYYVKNMSLFFDLSIFVRTFKVILFGRGAR